MGSAEYTLSIRLRPLDVAADPPGTPTLLLLLQVGLFAVRLRCRRPCWAGVGPIDPTELGHHGHVKCTEVAEYPDYYAAGLLGAWRNSGCDVGS